MRAISPSSRMISQMTPAGSRPGQARQIDRALGLAGAHQHAAAARAQRKDVPGRDQIVGPASRATATRMVSARSRAEMPVVIPWRASMLTVNAVCAASRLSAVIIGSPSWRHALLGQRQADEAAPVAGHEVDRLGRDQVGGHRQVALVLAILVVDQDDHPAGADRPRWRARRRRAIASARLSGQRRTSAASRSTAARAGVCARGPSRLVAPAYGRARRRSTCLAIRSAFEVDRRADRPCSPSLVTASVCGISVTRKTRAASRPR